MSASEGTISPRVINFRRIVNDAIERPAWHGGRGMNHHAASVNNGGTSPYEQRVEHQGFEFWRIARTNNAELNFAWGISSPKIAIEGLKCRIAIKSFDADDVIKREWQYDGNFGDLDSHRALNQSEEELAVGFANQPKRKAPKLNTLATISEEERRELEASLVGLNVGADFDDIEQALQLGREEVVSWLTQLPRNG